MPGGGTVTIGKCACCGERVQLIGGVCDYCRYYWNKCSGTKAV